VWEQSAREPPYPTRVFFLRGWGWEDFDFRSRVTLPPEAMRGGGVRDLNIGNPIFVLGSNGPRRPVCLRVRAGPQYRGPVRCGCPCFLAKEKKRKPYHTRGLPVLCSSAVVAPVSAALGWILMIRTTASSCAPPCWYQVKERLRASRDDK
jgi:hypothetical protein